MSEGMRQRDVQLEKEVAALLDNSDPHAAWIVVGHISSAVTRRTWYAKVKAAIGKMEAISHENA